MTATNLDVDGLDNPERAQLLSVVDEFRGLGISKEISLPQLVVVGDQSSGKSSLLEGLTGISFPTHSGLCTRFATRIILRRSGDRHVKVSIIPGPSSANDSTRKKALLNFRPKLKTQDLVGSGFTEVMDKAAVVMGLPSSTEKEVNNLDRRFSDDILSITLSGPEHQHLSIVDVPGLFHNPTPTQTQGDLDTIRTMIKSFMEDKRTIMLTVMDALNNLANQEIFHMAKSADDTGERIVGVITKCDAVSAHDERPIIKVAKNEEYVFRHGWFAVRNSSTAEKKEGVTLAQRHAREADFFERAPWSELSRDRVGVPALKTYLAQLLYDHIRNEFPQLVNDIRIKVLETRKQVEAYGDSRKTSAEQRHFLTRLANQFQTRNTEAAKGNYSPMLKIKDPRKLRMHIASENDELAMKIRSHGHVYDFKKVDDADEEREPTGVGADAEGDGTGDVHMTQKHEASSDGSEQSYASDSEDDDEDGETAEPVDIYTWIRLNYRTSRGAELPGTVNPAVLESLFRQQAAPWEEIARNYLEAVNKIVQRHINRSCQEMISDKVIRQKLIDRNKRTLGKTRDLAIAQLDQILEDEFGGILQTTNNYFAENLEMNRRNRLLIRLKRYLAPMEQSEDDGTPVHVGLNLDELINQAHLSNEDSAVFDIHDILNAYYKVAMKRFVDTVVLQVTERHFLGCNGPLKYFSPSYVGGLSDEELRNLAGESKATTMERDRLTTLVRQLERALKLGEAQQ